MELFLWWRASVIHISRKGTKRLLELSHVQLFCDRTDCSPPGSSVCRILQARILEWVAISSPGGSSQPKDQTESPAPQADSLSYEPTGKPRLLNSALPQTLHLLKKKKKKCLQSTKKARSAWVWLYRHSSPSLLASPTHLLGCVEWLYFHELNSTSALECHAAEELLIGQEYALFLFLVQSVDVFLT